MENFTRGAIVGRAGVVIGAGLSALIGNWAGKKWGKSETAGRTWALRDEIVNRWIVEQGGTPKGTLLTLSGYRCW